MAEGYLYTELEKGQIRILHLRPHLEEGLLQGSMRKIALKDAENAFVALSWSWGKESKAEDLRKIKIDGQMVNIRPNLWDMLDTFRKKGESMSLWVDAICINQDKSKPQDKNSQIPMMADIYKAATEVYIWLGPSADDSDYVMGALSGNDEEAYKSSRFVIGLIEMLRRPWWTRTWILQEYLLNPKSPKIFCGEALGVSAELMLKVWTRRSTQAMVSQVNSNLERLKRLGTIYWLHSLRDSRYNPNGVHLERNLRNALLWLKGFEVTEPRDNIHGALGLIEAGCREQFVKKVGVQTDQTAAKVQRWTETDLVNAYGNINRKASCTGTRQGLGSTSFQRSLSSANKLTSGSRRH